MSVADSYSFLSSLLATFLTISRDLRRHVTHGSCGGGSFTCVGNFSRYVNPCRYSFNLCVYSLFIFNRIEREKGEMKKNFLSLNNC